MAQKDLCDQAKPLYPKSGADDDAKQVMFEYQRFTEAEARGV